MSSSQLPKRPVKNARQQPTAAIWTAGNPPRQQHDLHPQSPPVLSGPQGGGTAPSSPNSMESDMGPLRCSSERQRSSSWWAGSQNALPPSPLLPPPPPRLP